MGVRRQTRQAAGAAVTAGRWCMALAGNPGGALPPAPRQGGQPTSPPGCRAEGIAGHLGSRGAPACRLRGGGVLWPSAAGRGRGRSEVVGARLSGGGSQREWLPMSSGVCRGGGGLEEAPRPRRRLALPARRRQLQLHRRGSKSRGPYQRRRVGGVRGADRGRVRSPALRPRRGSLLGNQAGRGEAADQEHRTLRGLQRGGLVELVDRVQQPRQVELVRAGEVCAGGQGRPQRHLDMPGAQRLLAADIPFKSSADDARWGGREGHALAPRLARRPASRERPHALRPMGTDALRSIHAERRRHGCASRAYRQ
mmetsp:Transcript_43144/g.138776  ORF Transcript_43144/g.138776 Transcript_43144/m.138776 type:complete len:311 (-) Transcript_43144:2084-3016(-)